VRDLIEEVFDHIARTIDLPVMKEPHLDEVAVPPIHLVEAATGHDIGTREIEQSVLADRQHVTRQGANLGAAHPLVAEHRRELAFDAGPLFCRCDVKQPRLARLAGHLRIGQCLEQIAVRSRQRYPALLYVRAQFGEKRFVG
jgi:hypothetical protein